jgi:hypothetical protein
MIGSRDRKDNKLEWKIKYIDRFLTWKYVLSYEPMSSVASMRKLRAEGRGWGSSGTARTYRHTYREGGEVGRKVESEEDDVYVCVRVIVYVQGNIEEEYEAN